MAPYGACEVAQSTARSNAQFEAELLRKGLRRKNKHDRNCCRRKKSMLESALEEKKTCSSSVFERSVASKHASAVISSAQWPRRKKKHARALISNAQSPSGATESNLEQ